MPGSAVASDFGPLIVGMSSFAIAMICVLFGVRAVHIAGSQTGRAAFPHLFCIVALEIIGIAAVLDEAAHLSDKDFFGMMLLLIVPGVLALVAPVLLSRFKHK